VLLVEKGVTSRIESGRNKKMISLSKSIVIFCGTCGQLLERGEWKRISVVIPD